MAEPTVDDLVFDGNGLIPAIAQDASTGRVLMLAWMNRTAYVETLSDREATFWSRSRQEIWRKGATSGNRLAVESVAVDCDHDAVLLSVAPAGPACHTGSVSCFDDEHETDRFDELATLWSTISHRLAEPSTDSYTAQLAAGGPETTGRKVLEEASEVVEAAIRHARGQDDDARLTEEVADVLYHTLVLMAERGIRPHVVMDELMSRRTPRAT